MTTLAFSYLLLQIASFIINLFLELLIAKRKQCYLAKANNISKCFKKN